MTIDSASLAFEDFVRDPDFPCVGAKSALGKGQLKTYVARSIASAWNDVEIHDQLMKFAWSYRQSPKMFTSFAVIFETPETLDESQFERCLWERVQSLTEKDNWRGQRPDVRVSDNPTDPHFSLSFGGEAFFVVGLHPLASRPARRFAHPTMVFNVHDQFETLRSEDRYAPLRKAILDRDFKLSGSANPMLADHGKISEARQYSGRHVSSAWTCPYNRNYRNLGVSAQLTQLKESC